MEMNVQYNSFVAVGDSFTEGMSDGLPDGSYRGWADLLAARLATRAPGFRYANLAVRGKLIDQIADEQCGPAASMGAELVTLVGGLNDVLRPKCDVERVCARLTECAELLARGGGRCQVACGGGGLGAGGVVSGSCGRGRLRWSCAGWRGVRSFRAVADDGHPVRSEVKVRCGPGEGGEELLRSVDATKALRTLSHPRGRACEFFPPRRSGASSCNRGRPLLPLVQAVLPLRHPAGQDAAERHCAATHDRDVNAAKNLLAAGLATTACGAD
ncbi:GDSL-type esterase/lipase family protein [Streptomyces sp. NPDC057743]|uniref:SGNH/GDSL hydrolase family protein n=1 Tax=Streptomyces sp. NPDC057743 TaxID=3346236 RepID=UPI00367A972D